MFSYFPEYCAEIYDSEKDGRNYKDPKYFTLPFRLCYLLKYKRVKNNYGFVKMCKMIRIYSKGCSFEEIIEKNPTQIVCFIKENKKMILELGEICEKKYM